MQLQEIGVVHNTYKNLTDIPRQGRMSEEISEIEIHPNYADGLLKIEQNQYLIVLYWAHLAKRDILKTIPPAAKELHGVFASRSPGPLHRRTDRAQRQHPPREGTGCPLGQCHH